MPASSPPSSNDRIGVCCAGNWIVDHVKTVNVWPAEETLATILAENDGTGGSPYNVSINLARFGATFPISAVGLVGDDEDGRHIRAHLDTLDIDTTFLGIAEGFSTSYTDVITVKETGRRTFFHHRGANAQFGPEHVPVESLSCRILTLGYLLLLDALDAEDHEFGTAAARVFAKCRAAGIRTAVDVVSEKSDRFARIIRPALPHVDYLIINELEAAQTTGRTVRNDSGDLDGTELEAAARDLLDAGACELVAIHAPEGALAIARDDQELLWQPSLTLPAGWIKGCTGAGDAFFAGMIFGLHEGWPLPRTLRFAHGAAATCLRHPTCTEGVGTREEIETLCERMA